MQADATQYELVCFGDATLDHLFRIRGHSRLNSYGQLESDCVCYGGKAPNAAYAAAKLTGPVGVSLQVGSDFEEIGYLAFIRASQVAFDLGGQFRETRQTVRFFSVFDGLAHTVFVKAGVDQEDISLKLSFFSQVARSIRTKAVYCCFWDQRLNDAVLREFRGNQNVIKAYNAADSLDELDAWSYGELLDSVDILFANEVESAYLVQREASSIDRILDSHRLALFVRTEGEYGCTLFSDAGEQHVPGAKAGDVVDPVGAGDCFAGTFLADLLKNGDPYSAAIAANRAAAQCVQRFGVG